MAQNEQMAEEHSSHARAVANGKARSPSTACHVDVTSSVDVEGLRRRTAAVSVQCYG